MLGSWRAPEEGWCGAAAAAPQWGRTPGQEYPCVSKERFQHCHHAAHHCRQAESGPPGLSGFKGLKSCAEPSHSSLGTGRAVSRGDSLRSLRAAPALPLLPPRQQALPAPSRIPSTLLSTNHPSNTQQGPDAGHHCAAQLSIPLCRHRRHQNIGKTVHTSLARLAPSATHPSHPLRHRPASSTEQRHPGSHKTSRNSEISGENPKRPSQTSTQGGARAGQTLVLLQSTNVH